MKTLIATLLVVSSASMVSAEFVSKNSDNFNTTPETIHYYGNKVGSRFHQHGDVHTWTCDFGNGQMEWWHDRAGNMQLKEDAYGKKVIGGHVNTGMKIQFAGSKRERVLDQHTEVSRNNILHTSDIKHGKRLERTYTFYQQSRDGYYTIEINDGDNITWEDGECLHTLHNYGLLPWDYPMKGTSYSLTDDGFMRIKFNTSHNDFVTQISETEWVYSTDLTGTKWERNIAEALAGHIDYYTAYLTRNNYRFLGEYGWAKR